MNIATIQKRKFLNNIYKLFKIIVYRLYYTVTHLQNIYNEISMFKGYIHKFNRSEQIIFLNLFILYVLMFFVFTLFHLIIKYKLAAVITIK